MNEILYDLRIWINLKQKFKISQEKRLDKYLCILLEKSSQIDIRSYTRIHVYGINSIRKSE